MINRQKYVIYFIMGCGVLGLLIALAFLGMIICASYYLSTH